MITGTMVNNLIIFLLDIKMMIYREDNSKIVDLQVELKYLIESHLLHAFKIISIEHNLHLIGILNFLKIWKSFKMIDR